MQSSAMELLYKLHAYAYNPSINIPNPYVDQSALESKKDESLKPKKEAKRRTQVKIACIHCKKACKKCDNARPCTRCIRTGTASSCVDAPRKERRKTKEFISGNLINLNLESYDPMSFGMYNACMS